jgi:hypothetical protein
VGDFFSKQMEAYALLSGDMSPLHRYRDKNRKAWVKIDKWLRSPDAIKSLKEQCMLKYKQSTRSGMKNLPSDSNEE